MLFLKSLKRYENKNSLPKRPSYFSDLGLCQNPLICSYRLKKLSLFNLSASSGIESTKKYFWNQTFDKGRLKNFVLWFFLKYGEHKTVRLVEELKTIGFQYATKAGISLGVEDLKIPPKKAALIHEAESLSVSTIRQFKRGEITEVERFQRLIDTWHRTSEQLKVEVIENFEGTDVLNPVYMMAFSGARGNISQVRQLVGMRGLMSNPQGQIIDFPIRSNFREGLTLTEYIISSYGARKGIVDTALRTANAGYLTRRLVDVAQHVIISSTDCGTNRGIFLTDMKEGNKTIYSLQNRLIGRVLARDIYNPTDGTSNKLNKLASKNTEISGELATLISQHHKKVFVRSSLTCQTNKLVCQLCYGWSLAQGNLVSIGEAVGIVAAQSIGEPGTQLTMRTFHTGGVFAGNVSDQIKAPFDGFVIYKNPIAGKLIRTPEGKIAFLTKDEGSFSVYKMPTSSDSISSMGNFSPKLTKLDPLEKRNFKIPFYTLLFLRNGEKAFQKQVIAQISSINRQKTATDQAEFTIKAEISGLFYSKNLEIEETKVGPIKDNNVSSLPDGSNDSLLDTINRSWSWGYAWILSGNIYQLPLPSSFFPIFGDFVTKKSFLNCVNWYMPNTFGSGFKLNRPLNFSLFNTKALKLMRNSFSLSSSNTKGSLNLSGSSSSTNRNKKLYAWSKNSPYNKEAQQNSFSSGEAVNIKKTGLIEKDFKLLKFDLISFELSKITYKNIGYFLKLSNPVSEELPFSTGQQKNLVPFYQKNQTIGKTIGTSFSQQSILSQQDHLFLYSSLFPHNRFFNVLKTNKSLQTNTRNPLINPSTWEPSFNVFLNWFPKRFFTQTAGIIFFVNNDSIRLFGKPVGENNALSMPFGYRLNPSLKDKYLIYGEQKRNFYVESLMSNPKLNYPKNYLNFTLYKNKSISSGSNKKFVTSQLSSQLAQSPKQTIKALSFPTFFKKNLLEQNLSKVGFSKTNLKTSKKFNPSFLAETQNPKNQTGSSDSMTNPLEFQADSTFKTHLNKKLKLNNLLQTLIYEQYPKNLLGNSIQKGIDGTTGGNSVTGHQGLSSKQGAKFLGYYWKNLFKYNWGLSSQKRTKDFTKNFFKRAFWVQQPFYKIRDKNNSIIITAKATDLGFFQTNRQGKTRLIEFIENCAHFTSINNQVNGICLGQNNRNVNRLKTLSFFNLLTIPKAKNKKNESRDISNEHTLNNNLLQRFKKETVYKLPSNFCLLATKKQDGFVKRKYIFGLLCKNHSTMDSNPDKHSEKKEPQNKLTTLKSYCKISSIPYFLPKKVQTFLARKKQWSSPAITKNIKNLISLSLQKQGKNNVNKNSKMINIFNFYFYSLFNKKTKPEQSAYFKTLLKDKYQLICSPYLENQFEQKIDLSLLKGHRKNDQHVSWSKSGGQTEMFQRTQYLLNWSQKGIYSENKYFQPKTLKKWYKKMGSQAPKRMDNLFIWNTPVQLKNLSNFTSTMLEKRKPFNGHTNGLQQNSNKKARKSNINTNKTQLNLHAQENQFNRETNINLWLKNGYFYYTTDLTKFFLYNKKLIQPGTNLDPHFSFDKNTVYLEILPLQKQSLYQAYTETEFLLKTDFKSSNLDSFSKKRRSGFSNGDTQNNDIQGQIGLNKKGFIKEEKWLKSFQKENKIKIIKEKQPNTPKMDDKEQNVSQNLSEKNLSKKIIELDFSQMVFNKKCRFKVEKTQLNSDSQFTDFKTKTRLSSSEAFQQKNKNSFSLNNRRDGNDNAHYIIFIRKAVEYNFVKEVEYKKDIYSLATQKFDTVTLSNIKTNINRFYTNKQKKPSNFNSFEQSSSWELKDPVQQKNSKQKNKLTIDSHCLPEKTIKPVLKERFLQIRSKNKQFVGLQVVSNQNKAFLKIKSPKLTKKQLNQSFYSIRLYSNYQTSLLNKQKTTGQLISKYSSSQIKLIFNNPILFEILKKENSSQKYSLPVEGFEPFNKLSADQSGTNHPLFDKVRKWGGPSVMMTSLNSINLSPFILSYKSPYSVNFPFKTPMCFFSQQYQPSFIFNNPWDLYNQFDKIKSMDQSPSGQKNWRTTSRLSRYKQLKSLEYKTLKQFLSNYIFKIKALNLVDKKDFGYNSKSNNSMPIENKNRLFELGKTISNLSSIFFSPIVDYSLVNEFPKSIPTSLFQEQKSNKYSSVDGQRGSIFNNINLKKQNLFLNHSDNKKFLFGKKGPLLPSLGSGSPTSNNSFARFNETNEDLALKIKKVLYKNDFISYFDNSVNSQNPVIKTYAYSSVEGEMIYQKKSLKKMDLEPSLLYNEIMSLKKGSPDFSINKLIRRQFTDFFLSTKPVDHIEYSCLILTKNDQICYSLAPKKVSDKNKQNYKEIYFSLEKQKKENQYFINNIVINLLNILATETNTDTMSMDIGQKNTAKSEESCDISKFKMDEIFSGLLKNDFTNQDLSQTGALELNKIPAGLAQQRSKLLIGEFLVYGDKINPTLAIAKSGQIIHINNNKVTLRKGQPIFVSPQAILHKYDGDFVEEQSSVITLAYQQLKTGDIVQGIPKIEQFFEARTTKRGRLFRDSLENLLKAIFNRYNTKLPRDQAVRQSFYKIQQIIIDGVQRVYRSQGVTIADKHLEIIVKQMTSKVRITFGGTTGYLPGEICDLYDIELINKDIRPKILYEPIVLGITKASLEVKSFLSAASFQQTTRVLTKAALSRKTDYLNGLKENVILGNLIPAGTGYLVYLDQYTTNQ